MISRTLATKFIEQVTEYTEYNVNIMDEEGVIIASRNPERVGQYHEIAYRIVHGGDDIVDTTLTESYPNVLPGINMVIELDGHREGVVGVTGEPEEIRSVALMIKMAMQSMLRYEKQQEQARHRENRKERFIHMLTEVEYADANEMRELAEELGYPEERIRIPILVALESGSASDFLTKLKKSPYHTLKDVSLALDDQRVIIFKTMPDTVDALFSDYKYIIGEYLSPVLRWMNELDTTARFYIGSFQDTYARYYYSYRHCRWLQEHVKSQERAVFFYDHVGEYVYSTVSMRDMSNMFYIYESRFPQGKMEEFIESMGALICCNYNFSKAAKRLFIHKNTLVYRYNKYKELFNVDPMLNASDRSFLEGFYAYMVRRLNKDTI
ncbi:MAG: helix-turn-helix domain-containing protein [Lachnospiraceae bacterium]|nr:helix-turn-helix domain-containing protein [Lachnospiraceae bacterium]